MKYLVFAALLLTGCKDTFLETPEDFLLYECYNRRGELVAKGREHTISMEAVGKANRTDQSVFRCIVQGEE